MDSVGASALRRSRRNRTSRRIHKEIVVHLMGAGSIEFAITTAVEIDGKAADLRRKSARRSSEDAAVLLTQTNPGTRVLNIDAGLEGDTEQRSGYE